MARELEGKVAVVTGAASGIGLASTEAMLAAGSRVVMVDRDEAGLKALCNKHGDAVIPLIIDLLDNAIGGSAAERLVLMNAAAAIHIAGRASDLKQAYSIAEESIRSGAAFDKLTALREGRK